MDSIIKNYEEVLEKPPSTRIFLKFLKHKIDSRRQYKKNIKNKTNHVHNEKPEGIEVSSFAIVLDGVVVDIMHVQKEFGDILKKSPEFIFIDDNAHIPHQGWIYRDGSFISMHDILKEAHPTVRG